MRLVGAVGLGLMCPAATQAETVKEMLTSTYQDRTWPAVLFGAGGVRLARSMTQSQRIRV